MLCSQSSNILSNVDFICHIGKWIILYISFIYTLSHKGYQKGCLLTSLQGKGEKIMILGEDSLHHRSLWWKEQMGRAMWNGLFSLGDLATVQLLMQIFGLILKKLSLSVWLRMDWCEDITSEMKSVPNIGVSGNDRVPLIRSSWICKLFPAWSC